SALEWSLQGSDPIPALRLVAALWYFWYTRGHYTEGEQWRKRALAKPSKAEGEPSALRARAHALNAMVIGYWDQAIVGEWRLESEEALALGTQLGDDQIIAWSCRNLGCFAMSRGDYATSRMYLERSQSLFRERADLANLSGSLM